MRKVRGEVLLLNGETPPEADWVVDGTFALDESLGILYVRSNGTWVTAFELLASGDPASGNAATWDGADPTWTAN